jgi:hypothetical protein
VYSIRLLFVISILAGATVYAQFPPKEDDQLKRQKVLIQVPLGEKINKPLISREELIYTKPTKYTETNGIIESLLMGLKTNKYNAYHGDSLNWAQPMTWNDLLDRHKKFNDPGLGEDDEGSSGFEEIDGEAGSSDEFGDGGGEDALASGGGNGSRLGIDIAPYTEKLEILEDRIFDKKRSDMYYDVQYIRLVWVDPGQVAPDKIFVAFKYSDVMAQLDDTQWKNLHNDSEYRTMREVIELRMYHGVIIDVSGRGDVTTLDLAEYRRNQLVEYEHNLWHY